VQFEDYRRKYLAYILISVPFVLLLNVISDLYFLLNTVDGSLNNNFLSFMYFMNYVYCNAFAFQFACAAICIRDRFNLLHNKMRSMSNFNSYEIGLVIDLYRKLFNVINLVNAHLSFQLIPAIGYMLMSTFFTLYGMARLFFVNSSFKYLFLWCEVLNITVDTAVLVNLIYCSVTAVESAEKFFDIAYEVKSDLHIQNRESEVRFFNFVKFIKGKKIRLGTAFFDIDWKLLFSVS
jgi:hypothetical protein